MHKKLLIPGPTEVSGGMLSEQKRFLIGHRTNEFTVLYTGIIKKLMLYITISDLVNSSIHMFNLNIDYFASV